jgi:hypothetical protein
VAPRAKPTNIRAEWGKERGTGPQLLPLTGSTIYLASIRSSTMFPVHPEGTRHEARSRILADPTRRVLNELCLRRIPVAWLFRCDDRLLLGHRSAPIDVCDQVILRETSGRSYPCANNWNRGSAGCAMHQYRVARLATIRGP